MTDSQYKLDEVEIVVTLGKQLQEQKNLEYLKYRFEYFNKSAFDGHVKIKGGTQAFVHPVKDKLQDRIEMLKSLKTRTLSLKLKNKKEKVYSLKNEVVSQETFVCKDLTTETPHEQQFAFDSFP